jgi:hypothetical protein
MRRLFVSSLCILLLGAGSLRAADKPEPAVSDFLKALQAGDEKAILASYPDDLRRPLEQLLPLGKQADEAVRRLDAVLVERYGGTKGQRIIDPADMLPLVVRLETVNPGTVLLGFEVLGSDAVDADRATVRVRLRYRQDGKELSGTARFTAVRTEKGWKYLGDRAYPYGLDDPERVAELVDFAKRLRAGCEHVEKDVKAGKYPTRADALEVLTMLAAPVPKR